MATSTQVERGSDAVTTQPKETVLTGFPYRPHRSLLEFLRGEPQVLGAVQILLGLIIAGLGSIIIFNFVIFSQRFPLVFLTGYPFWGALTFLLAGYFTGTQEKPKTCLRQCVMPMNVISSLAAIAGIVLTMISYKDEHRFCQIPSLEGVCVVGKTLINGILSIILIASIVELSISISMITLRNQCWTKSHKIVFFLPSDITEDNENPAPGADARFQFELPESPTNDRARNTDAFSFGGYTFFRLRVSGSPQSQKIVPVAAEHQEPLENTTSIQPEKAEDPQPALAPAPPPRQIQLLEAQTLPLEVFPSHSAQSYFQKLRALPSQEMPSHAVPSQLIESQSLIIKGPLVPTTEVLFNPDVLPESLPAQVQDTQAKVVECPLVCSSQVLLFQDLPSSPLPIQMQEAQAQVVEGPLVPTVEVLLFQDLPSHALPHQLSGLEISTIEGPLVPTEQILLFHDTPPPNLLSEDQAHHITELPVLASQDTPLHDTSSEYSTTQDTLDQNTASKEVSSQALIAIASKSTDQQFLNVLYQDIRSEVMLQTQVWEVDLHVKKSSRRNSIIKQTKSYHSPKRSLLDTQSSDQKFPRRKSLGQESQGQKCPRRKSVGRESQGQKSPRRKSVGQESQGQKSPRQESVSQESQGQKSPKQESVSQESQGQKSPKQESVDQESQGQKSPRQKSVSQESQGQKSPRRKSIDQQIKDWIFAKRKSIDSCENGQPPRKQSSNFQRGQGETQKPPKRQDKHQQTDMEEAPRLKPEAKEKKAPSKKVPMDHDWKLQTRESQDWISQGWRNRDWKAKEWDFEKQNILNWPSQNLQEQEALRQRALYQDIRSKRTETRLDLDQKLPEGQIQDIQGQNKLQQDLLAKATQTEDMQPGGIQTRIIKPECMKPNDQKPKDSQPEKVRSNDPSSSCPDTEQDPYFAYLSSVSLEQYVERDTSVCSALYKEEMDLASTSCYQKDQPSEDSD